MDNSVKRDTDSIVRGNPWAGLPQKERFEDNNPWPGLSSYEDPEESIREGRKPKLFCGRDDESHLLTQLITNNLFITLYGKSGTGKSSLLKAGVFPRLRQKRYLPVYTRLSIYHSFQQCIVSQISKAISEHHGHMLTIEVVPVPADEQAPDYLWSYFARTRFVDSEGRKIFPVIVLDQFEEIFRNRREEAEILLRQIAYLMDESHALTPRIVDGQPYNYDFNFRFVASIREDELYRLEDSIDNNYLQELKRCRYRLRSLTKQGACDAILIPGKRLFAAEEEQHIVDVIISRSRNEDGSISTIILSLLCSWIYAEFLKSGAELVTSDFVYKFIKGNPFERLYNEATRGFSNKEKSYIEDHLVDSAGRRNSITERDFLLHVPHGERLLVGDTRILQRTSASSDGSNYRIELIHDTFCEPLKGLQEKREKRKRIWQILIAVCIAVFSISSVIYVMNINHKMNVNMSRIIANAAELLANDYDSYLARLVALEALPPNRPYTVEAERALRLSSIYDDAILRKNRAPIYTVSFSPDGKRIVSAAADDTIRIWDAENGKEIMKLEEHTSIVKSAFFSPDGKRIVSVAEDGTIHIWDAENGKEILKYEENTDIVNSASFSPDGKRIVSAEWNGTIHIWDAGNGKEIQKLEGHTDIVNSASFSPDGKRIVSAAADETIRIWDAENGKEIQKLEGHTDMVSSASFSPDGKRIVSAAADETIRIWDAENGKEIQKLEGHTDMVSSASFSPDGKRIVSASWDRTIRIWDAGKGEEIQKYEGNTDIVNFATFSPDGKRIVSAANDGTILILDTEFDKQCQKLVGHKSYVNSALFSPDGKHIVSAADDRTIRIWDAGNGKEILKLDGIKSSVSSASFSPDGKRIVSAAADETIRIWDAEIGKVLQKLEGHTSFVNSAFFSPDGKRIVSASNDGTIRIWDAGNGEEILKLDGNTSIVEFASFSPNGKRIVSATNDGTISIWDAGNGEEILKLDGNTFSVSSVSFSPDGKHIVSAAADGTISILDAGNGKGILKLKGHTDCVNSASFSPDGKHIVSASNDRTIRIWDAGNGKEILKMQGHTTGVNSASFSPDGKHIVSAAYDRTICIWDFPPLQDLIEQTRERFKNRPLTDEEKKKYYIK